MPEQQKNKQKKFSKSVSKFIRKEKARIRREVLDKTEQGRRIKDLYGRFSK